MVMFSIKRIVLGRQKYSGPKYVFALDNLMIDGIFSSNVT